MQQSAILNLKNINGTFDWIFVHHAADILQVLQAKYNTPHAAKELLNLGDLSRLELHKATQYHADLHYPKASCFHRNNPEPKRNMSYEYDFSSRKIRKDESIKYFIFDESWQELEWSEDGWRK